MKKSGTPKRHTGFSLPSLMLAFSAVAGLFSSALPAAEASIAPIPAETYTLEQQPEKTYWRHPQYDAVMEVWTDPVKGIRGKVVSLNADDLKVREAIGRILRKDVKKVTTEDVKSFVGMEGELSMRETSPGKWEGTVYWPYKKKFYGLDVEQKEGKLKAHGFFINFPIFGRTVELVRAEKPAEQKVDIALATPPKP